MKVLLTGGAGCLGSNITEFLAPISERVVIIDNFATGKLTSIPDDGVVEVVEGSVTDSPLVEDIFSSLNPDLVIHGAASYKDPNDWYTDANTNVVGSIQIARACERWGVSRLVNLQTALCYGVPKAIPIPVDHPTAPITSYGITKTAGEALLLQSAVSTVSLRIANVVAPRLSIGPIPAFYKRLKSNQPCTVTQTVRDFLDFRDFMKCLQLVIERDDVSGVLNVSSGEGHSIAEIFEQVAFHLGMSGRQPDEFLPPAPDDIPTVVLDPSKTFEKIGWKVEVGFDETISSMLSWYDRYGVTDVFSHLQERR
jgi:UDP-glucose 4-epimerase